MDKQNLTKKELKKFLKEQGIKRAWIFYDTEKGLANLEVGMSMLEHYGMIKMIELKLKRHELAQTGPEPLAPIEYSISMKDVLE